ncbi:MAG: helix-turn-helix transcriptional regulator [Solirubrobacterales bacterium]
MAACTAAAAATPPPRRCAGTVSPPCAGDCPGSARADAGVSSRTQRRPCPEVSRIEAGKRDPRVSTMERLAKALDIPPSDLLR